MANIIVIESNAKTVEVQTALAGHGCFVAANGLKKDDIVFLQSEDEISVLGVITGGAGYDSMAKKGIASLSPMFKDKETFEKTNGLKFYKSEIHGSSDKAISVDDFNTRVNAEDITNEERVKIALAVAEELKSDVVVSSVKRIGLELK